MRIRSQTSMPLWVYRSIATRPQRLPLICCRCLPALAFPRGRLTIAVFRGRFLCCRHPGHPLVRCDRLSCEDNIIDRERRRLLDFSQTFPVRHYILKLNDRLRVPFNLASANSVSANSVHEIIAVAANAITRAHAERP
jgi:hypothetical protein